MTASRRRSHVLVLAKAPLAGKVKTRLCPPYTIEEAAAIAEAALADTLEAVARCQADRKVIALDGPPGPWLPPGFELLAQRGQCFDARLANAWSDVLSAPAAGPSGWGLQIGMDTPQASARLLDDQLAILEPTTRPTHSRPKALLGEALDGGWWLIGLAGADPAAVFTGVPMSTAHTGAAQARRLRSLGFSLLSAPVLRDIDDVDDLLAVARTIPSSRTAAAAMAMGVKEAVGT